MLPMDGPLPPQIKGTVAKLPSAVALTASPGNEAYTKPDLNLLIVTLYRAKSSSLMRKTQSHNLSDDCCLLLQAAQEGTQPLTFINPVLD
jgi:hypothetical protein